MPTEGRSGGGGKCRCEITAFSAPLEAAGWTLRDSRPSPWRRAHTLLHRPEPRTNHHQTPTPR
jgi:hypothetical protein